MSKDKLRLLQELEETRQALDLARQQFDNCNEDMIEACIFQIKAQSERYDSLLREVKGANE